VAGSVLETFFILFESDASEAKKDIKGMDKALDDTEKSAKDGVASSDKAGASFVQMGKSALGAVAGIFAIGSVIQGTLSKAAELDAIGKFARTLGEDVGDIDAWGQAVIRAGGSADSFQASIESLNEKVVDASIKGMNEIVPFFNQLGISIVDETGNARSTLDLLPELADAFENISNQESAALGKKLGLDPGTILLLQSGRKEVEALVERQRQLGVTTEEAVVISEKFNDQMADLRQIFGFASQSLLVSFLPSINAVLESFTDIVLWLGKNETLVEGFFIALGAVVAKFAIPPMISLAAATIAATYPFILIGALVAALAAGFALLYEDVIAYMNGQDSLLGEMEKRWPIVGDIIRGITEFIKGYIEVMKAFISGVGDVVGAYISSMKSLAEFLFDLFTAPEEALNKIMKAGGFIKDFLGFGGDDEEVVLNAQKSLALASSSGLASQTSTSIQNSNIQRNRSIMVQTGDTVIQTQATDPDGIAAEAANSMTNQIRAAVEDYDDGVDV